MTRDEFAATVQAIAINSLTRRSIPLIPESVEKHMVYICASFEAYAMQEDFESGDFLYLIMNGIKPFNIDTFFNEREQDEFEHAGSFEETLNCLRDIAE